MKLFCCILLVTLPLLSHSYPTLEDKTITLEDDPGIDSEHAETGGEVTIQKRSGSFDYVAHLKSGLLSSIGGASASIASASSGGSSSHDGGGSYKSVEYAQHGNSVEYDPWSFKKSVLNTIFQAVKAITGGVTALKGQLIKGSGYVLSASGKVVAAGGEKVTDVGKSIINSAQIGAQSYGTVSAGASVHPFAKFTSLSGASSGGSGVTKHVAAPGPVIHQETITAYEIPSGHTSYGPPSAKPPTYSTATHQYLPPGATYTSGGAPFSNGHASAFEAPATNYLPTGHGHYEAPPLPLPNDDSFNIYGKHKKLTDDEARKAAVQLQEILHLLPNGKTEYTASKTKTLDTSGTVNPTGPVEIPLENVDLQTYGLPNDLGQLESLSHTESITAAYGPPPSQPYGQNPSDIYRQMAKKQTPEEIYIQKHPNEAYDYTPPQVQAPVQVSVPVQAPVQVQAPLPVQAQTPENNAYKYNNFHAGNANGPTNQNNNALQDLTPIIAALEVAKRRQPNAVSTQYSVEKNVHKIQAIPAQGQQIDGAQSGAYNYLPPIVEQSKYTYFSPAEHKADANYRPVYSTSYKVNRHKRRLPTFKHQDYELTDPLLFNRLFTL